VRNTRSSSTGRGWPAGLHPAQHYCGGLAHGQAQPELLAAVTTHGGEVVEGPRVDIEPDRGVDRNPPRPCRQPDRSAINGSFALSPSPSYHRAPTCRWTACNATTRHVPVGRAREERPDHACPDPQARDPGVGSGRSHAHLSFTCRMHQALAFKAGERSSLRAFTCPGWRSIRVHLLLTTNRPNRRPPCRSIMWGWSQAAAVCVIPHLSSRALLACRCAPWGERVNWRWAAVGSHSDPAWLHGRLAASSRRPSRTRPARIRRAASP
jgi:hypothetical protein